MTHGGRATQAEAWHDQAIVEPAGSAGPANAARSRAPAPAAEPRAAAEGAPWAAALGLEASRLSGYLGLMARAAAFARAAGVAETAVADLAPASGSWPVALRAVAEAIGEEAGVHLRLVGGSAARDEDPPLGVLAVDLDDPAVRAEATARLAAEPCQLLPQLVVCLRSAASPPAGPERTDSPSGPAPGASAAASRGGRPEHRLTLPAARRLQPLSGRPWPVGPSAPGAVEWPCTYHVTDHPLSGVVHLPTRASRSASRDRHHR